MLGIKKAALYADYFLVSFDHRKLYFHKDLQLPTLNAPDLCHHLVFSIVKESMSFL